MKPYLHPRLSRSLVKFSDGSFYTYYTSRFKYSLWDIIYYSKDKFNHDLWRSKHSGFFFGLKF